MPRSIDNLLEAHHIATRRRNTGQPVWSRTLNLREIFHNPEMNLAQRGGAIVAAVRACGWPKIANDVEELEQMLEELADAADADDRDWFNTVWDSLCDTANIDRVWIETV